MELLTQPELETIAAHAVELWLSSAELSQLADVTLEMTVLQNGRLGKASSGTIRIDENAASWGSEPKPRWGSPTFNRMLPVLMREQGHLLGHSPADANEHNDELMAEDLSAGTQRLPGDEGITDELELDLELDGHSAFFADLDSDLLL